MKVSPHVSIYKFPVTAISSIATRLSGLYLSGAFVTIGISELMQNKKLYNTYDSLDNKYQKAINYSFILRFVKTLFLQTVKSKIVKNELMRFNPRYIIQWVE